MVNTKKYFCPSCGRLMCEMHAWSSIEVPPGIQPRPCKLCEAQSPNEIVQQMISKMPPPKAPPIQGQGPRTPSSNANAVNPNPVEAPKTLPRPPIEKVEVKPENKTN